MELELSSSSSSSSGRLEDRVRKAARDKHSSSLSSSNYTSNPLRGESGGGGGDLGESVEYNDEGAAPYDGDGGGGGGGGGEDGQAVPSWRIRDARELRRRVARYLISMLIFLVFIALTVVFSIRNSSGGGGGGGGAGKGQDYVIAFGSCTSYDTRDQPIWTTGVVPTAPDAWIWAGDMAYLDDPFVDCSAPDPMADQSGQCACDSGWLAQSPHGCMAASSDHALARWQAYLSNPDYLDFLEYMCPGALAEGLFPPPGNNRAVCPRPILGTYDDHDFGWNNGNRREPDKQLFKEMFLDAIGEPWASERRNMLRGAWGKESLVVDAGGGQQLDVDVFLLDERYDREPLPCWTFRPYCEAVLSAGPAGGRNTRHAWCLDFLNGTTAGADGEAGATDPSDVAVGVDGVVGGSCCVKDEEVFLGWCLDPASESDPLWPEACDVSSPDFGRRALRLDPHDPSRLVVVADPDGTGRNGNDSGGGGGGGGSGGGDDADARSEAEGYVDTEQGAPFCDVLGRPQRRWLRESLAASTAPLKLLVTGSVALGNPVWQDGGVYVATTASNNATAAAAAHGGSGGRRGTGDDGDDFTWVPLGNSSFCSSDDMDCYRAAQAELLYLAATADGCVLLLTGDYHWTDVKVLDASNDAHTYNIGPALERGRQRRRLSEEKERTEEERGVQRGRRRGKRGLVGASTDAEDEDEDGDGDGTEGGDSDGVGNKDGGGLFPGTGVVQVMSSGLTRSTSPQESCEHFLARGYTADVSGLRVGGEAAGASPCEAVITGGSFASIHLTAAQRGGGGKNKGKNQAKLKTLDVVLRDRDGKETYRHRIDPATCNAV